MSPNTRKGLWIGLGVGIIALTLCCMCGAVLLVASFPKIFSNLHLKSAVAVGEEAPDFRLHTLEGEMVQLSQLKGQPVVLNFGASWCPDCNLADPVLQELHEAHPEVMVLLVDMSETADAVQASVDKHGLTFPVLMDVDGGVGDLYEIVYIPTIFFIDENGVIQAKLVEAITWDLLDEALPLIGVEP